MKILYSNQLYSTLILTLYHILFMVKGYDKDMEEIKEYIWIAQKQLFFLHSHHQ